MDYLNKLHEFGVLNIEMECTIFAALTYHAGIRAAIICVTLLDRLKGDQVNTPKEGIYRTIAFIKENFLWLICLNQTISICTVMHEWQQRPQILVSRLIRKHLALEGSLKPLVATAGVGHTIRSPRRFKLVQQESEAHE